MSPGDIASIATAFGVLVAAWQLLLAHRQATTAFEDGLATQYRNLMQQLPVDALLGRPLSEDQHKQALPIFFHYFDFCNEQAFLRSERRIRRATWRNWQDGMRDNLTRPAFTKAWGEIAGQMPDSFEWLRKIAPPAIGAPSSAL